MRINQSNMSLAVLIGGIVAVISSMPTAFAQQAAAVNRGVVELETTGSDGISVRMAEDLARLIDDGATRRVLPVVGKSSLQNITDLRYLRGVDLAIVQADVLDDAKTHQVISGLDSLVYITKLYNEEFHLLARPSIKAVADLSGQKVNVDLPGSGTDITAARLFDQLKLGVTVTHDAPQVALDKLRKGDIAAIAFVTGKPAPLFVGLTGEDGLHFLPIPFDATQNIAYAPTHLTSADYPGLIKPDQPIDTIAVASILLAADLRQLPDRYNNVANFIDVFFTGFQSLLGPGYHPKWGEINLATEIPALRRHDAAVQWLRRNAQVSAIQDPDKLRDMFARFIDERRQAAGGTPMTDAEKAGLFQQFQNWRQTQKP
jgi:uncharacterized protein